MKTLKNIKNYSLGFVVGVACVSSIAYGASNGSIGASFLEVSGVWKLVGVNITDNSITSTQLATNSVENSELAANSVTQAKVSGGYVDRQSDQTVSGVKTFSDGINSNVTGDLTGNVTGNVVGNLTGNVTGNLAGNATTATRLQTPRTIAGINFDGTGPINIPFANLTSIPNTIGGYGITDAVTINTAQTITGQKTFSSQILANGGIQSTSFIYTSDRRFKENIETIQSPLKTVQALRGVTWNWKKDGKADVGFIAQEVEEVLPELVYTDKNGYKGVQYGNMVGLLVEAVKEQQKQIDELNAKLNALQK